jgi:hypothetical protein
MRNKFIGFILTGSVLLFLVFFALPVAAATVRIEWETINREQVASFQLMRKKDSGPWEKRGNLMPPNYKYTYDTQEEEGFYYYTIHILQRDGTLIEPEKEGIIASIKMQSSNIKVKLLCNESNWQIGEWGACSVACGGGLQTRTVTKINDCAGGDEKPIESQACNLSSCPVRSGTGEESDGAEETASGGESGQKSCADSDGGIDRTVFGAAKSGSEEKSDSCLLLFWHTELYCEGNEIKKSTVWCPGCADGVCAGTEQQEAGEPEQCIDSDGGIEQGIFGTVTLGEEQKSDYCFLKFFHNEYYCEGNEIKKTITWSLNCKGGAIDKEKTTGDEEKISKKCADSDGGKVYDVAGTCTDFNNAKYAETCGGQNSGAYVTETFCKEDGLSCGFETVKCPIGCKDGACGDFSPVVPKDDGNKECVDSDGGSIYDVKGTATVKNTGQTQTDICNGNTLTEYTCYNFNDTSGISSFQYNCPLGCVGGACVNHVNDCREVGQGCAKGIECCSDTCVEGVCQAGCSQQFNGKSCSSGDYEYTSSGKPICALGSEWGCAMTNGNFVTQGGTYMKNCSYADITEKGATTCRVGSQYGLCGSLVRNPIEEKDYGCLIHACSHNGNLTDIKGCDPSTLEYCGSTDGGDFRIEGVVTRYPSNFSNSCSNKGIYWDGDKYQANCDFSYGPMFEFLTGQIFSCDSSFDGTLKYDGVCGVGGCLTDAVCTYETDSGSARAANMNSCQNTDVCDTNIEGGHYENNGYVCNNKCVANNSLSSGTACCQNENCASSQCVKNFNASKLAECQACEYNIGCLNAHGCNQGICAVQQSSTPQNFKALGQNRSILLTWDAPAKNGDEAVISYNIYQADGSKLTTVNGLSYVDSGLTVDTQRCYTVTAKTLTSESEHSSQACARPNTALPMPPVMQSVNGYVNRIQVYFTPYFFDLKKSWEFVDEPTTSYYIYRGTSADSLTFYTALGTGSQIYDDYNVENDVTYYYKVTAVNAVGESDSSSVRSGTAVVCYRKQYSPSVSYTCTTPTGTLQYSYDYDAADDPKTPDACVVYYRTATDILGNSHGCVMPYLHSCSNTLAIIAIEPPDTIKTHMLQGCNINNNSYNLSCGVTYTCTKN